jgi:hypothetical protein
MRTCRGGRGHAPRVGDDPGAHEVDVLGHFRKLRNAFGVLNVDS